MKDTSTHSSGLFNPRGFGNFMVDKFMIEKFMGEEFMVEKFMVEE
jgi:hypothetical protein